MINMAFNFGHRKIQKIRYSFMVPLPVDWVKNLNLGKGNSLKIEMLDDHSLRITPDLQARQDSEGTGEPTPDYERGAGNEYNYCK
jgi:antitoxin component of MazEF toxin-antitoxin module